MVRLDNKLYTLHQLIKKQIMFWLISSNIRAFLSCWRIEQMISNSSKYALKALLYLARSDPTVYIKVEDISKRTQVPAPYLSKLLKQLTKKGVLIARRGVKGGVRLNRQKKELTFAQICQFLNDPIINKQCFLSNVSCNSAALCPVHNQWSKLREDLQIFLEKAKVF